MNGIQGSLLVVDASEEGRRDIVALFEQDGLRTFAVGCAEEALEQAAELRPRLALIEVELPGLSGYECLRRFRGRFGERLPVILLSRCRTEPFDRAAGILLGADDYIVKPFVPEELLARVRRLLKHSEQNGAHRPVLTPREQQVLELLATGHSQREIAPALAITPKTCAKHIERILEKLSVHSRAEAVAVAYRDQLVSLPA